MRNIQFMSSSDKFLFTGLKFRLVESLLFPFFLTKDNSRKVFRNFKSI